MDSYLLTAVKSKMTREDSNIEDSGGFSSLEASCDLDKNNFSGVVKICVVSGENVGGGNFSYN